MIPMQRIICFSSLWLLTRPVLILTVLLLGSLQAQVEVNVRVRPNGQRLKAWLDQPPASGIRSSNLPASLASTVPALQSVSAARSLTARPQQAQPLGIEQVYTLQLPEGQAPALIAQLRSSGLFEYVEPVRQYQIDRAPSYRPNDDSLGSQWYLPYLKAFDAWDRSQGSAQIRIGIIDTGIDYDHPDFEGQLAINAAEDLNGNGRFEPWPSSEVRAGRSGDFDGLDNDQNGYADDVIGYDFVDQPREPFGGDFLTPDPDPLDDNNHGTLVSGVIGAKANNQYGGSGLAPDCRLLTIRAFAASGVGDDDDVARAIVYAVDQGVQVLNFSFGDIYASSMMQEAIRYAYAQGVVMCASAGNGTGDALHYPSGHPEVISVSASHADYATGFEFLWPLSSYGLTVDLCAPGADIFTTTLRDTAPNGTVTAFTRTQGTSFSAPMVAAAAALLMSTQGPLSPEQVRGILTTTTDDISEPGWDHFTGAGRLNLQRALDAVGFSVVELLSPEHDGGSDRDTVAIVGTVLDPEFQQYWVEYKPGIDETGTWLPIVSEQPYQRQRDTLALWDLSGLPEGDYTLRIRLQRSNGATREDRIRFVRDLTPPAIEVTLAAPIWDNESRAFFLRARSDDAAEQVLSFRKQGSGLWQTLAGDRFTRNVEMLLTRDQLSLGTYEWFLTCTNAAGLRSQTPIQTFEYDGGYLNEAGWVESSYGLPSGRMIERPQDFDGDGLLEVVLNPYGAQLSLGPLFIYEFNGAFFRKVDSLTFRRVLIPRDVADSDGDGLLELLVSVNDSSYLIEQASANVFPHQEIYRNEGNGQYAARLADTDGDAQPELLVKDFEDYFVYKRQGQTFSQVAELTDVSLGYEGSIAPRVLVADFDGDGQTEIVYGDFDGDVLVYEHRGGNSYVNTLIDSSNLTKAGSYLTQGDFDGDGIPEFFVAAHTSPLRNSDFEYDPPYWWLRIFKAVGNDQYAVVWEDYLYDLDIDNTNAATAGNLDDDPADELVFTTFPRTYLLEQVNGQYQFTWFYYGSLADQHLIGDFNGNGQNELGLGRLDSLKFFEKDLDLLSPAPVTQLQGFMLGTNWLRLAWPASPSATGYELWRVPNPEVNDTAQVLTLGAVTSFEDRNVVTGTPYLYVLRAIGANGTSGFGRAVILTPRDRPRLDSVRPLSPQQVELWFSQPVADDPNQMALITLDDSIPAKALIQTGQPSQRLLVSFTQPLSQGDHFIRIDTTFLDAGRGVLDPDFTEVRFFYENEEANCLHLTQWRVLDDKRAQLSFNLPLDETLALDPSHYRMEPTGTVETVAWANEQMDALEVTIATARFGALGYPISLTVQNLCAIDETCLCPEGNTATFSSFKPDLQSVFAYPNPVRPHGQFEGMRFANLTRQASIEVFTLSGRYITRLEETDGDGGMTWNLVGPGGKRLRPGVYVFHVTTTAEGVTAFTGKFTVVE
jgi:subtilisin family serine protease